MFTALMSLTVFDLFFITLSGLSYGFAVYWFKDFENLKFDDGINGNTAEIFGSNFFTFCRIRKRRCAVTEDEHTKNNHRKNICDDLVVSNVIHM